MEALLERDVLICGAGAAGLALAIELARRGVSFALIEKMGEPFHGSRGKGIQPRTQEVFEDLGILDRVVAAGGVYPPQREYLDDGTTRESPMMETTAPTPAEPYQIPLMVPQFATERLMRERLAELGEQVAFGRELMRFEEDEDGVVAFLSGGIVVRARYLVGADGGRSFVRQALGIDFPGNTLGVRGLVADLVLTGVSRDAWHRWGEGDIARQISLCPLEGTELIQLQAPVPLEGEVDLSAGTIQSLIADRTGRRDIQVERVAWASAYQMNARLADRYRIGRTFLIGDAAHIHPPTGGQGLNTSVQDAYNLGWKLAAVIGGAPERLLDSYEAERRPIAAGMLGLATNLLDRMKQGEMKRGREVHQLDLGYFDSPLSMEAPVRGAGLRAGARAPDAPIRGAAGQAMRLFDLLRGPHWTLIGWEADRAGLPARAGLRMHGFGAGGDLADAAGHFAAAYGLKAGERVLVRPDGYLGAIVGVGEVEALEAYLADVGLTPPF